MNLIRILPEKRTSYILEHRFYSKILLEQKYFQLKLVFVFIGVNVLMSAPFLALGFAFDFMSDLLFFVILIFSLNLSIFAPFIDVPSGIKQGSLVYYSPLLIGEKIKNKHLTLHGGTLFDYYFVVDRHLPSRARKKLVFAGYIQGLLNLIEQHDKGQAPHITLRATSYSINPRTAAKVGLLKTDTSLIRRFIVYFNYLNLTCSMSIIESKLTFPNAKTMHTFEGKLDELISEKAYLKRLLAKLTYYGYGTYYSDTP